MTTSASNQSPIAYTIATLVNDKAQYEAMRATFRAFGFAEPDCEFLSITTFIDNTGAGQTEAYAGLNRLLDEARGRFVILCHQDVRLIGDGRAELDRRLADLERRDPGWALAGNAGGVRPGQLALRISDPHGANRRVGELPARVVTLDENFIVMKRVRPARVLARSCRLSSLRRRPLPRRRHPGLFVLRHRLSPAAPEPGHEVGGLPRRRGRVPGQVVARAALALAADHVRAGADLGGPSRPADRRGGARGRRRPRASAALGARLEEARAK